MNDKIIINAISKLHFVIVSAFLFIFLILSTSFIILQNGINIDNISLPNLHVKKLYIKWHEKLSISVKEIHIVQKKNKEQADFKLEDIKKNFKKALLFNDWFQSVEIEEIIFNDINGSFKYLEGENGFLIASNNDFSLKTSLFFEEHLLNIQIDRFSDYQREITIDGNIIFDGVDKLELFSSLNININNKIFLNSFIQADIEKLQYKVKSKKGIIDYRHVIDIVNMPKEVKYWAYEAIRASTIKIQSFHGWFEYDKMDEAFTNLYIKLLGKDLTYAYHTELEPVITKETEVILNNGVLYIYPKKAYQYGFYLGKSWIKIDFTKKEELLTLVLLFQGKVNKDLLHLLNKYKIKLPIEQNSGVVDTDLTIEVGLRSIDVTAKGKFYTKEANFNYLGLDIDIYDATIFLDNYDVIINNMHSKYENIAVADVDLKYNAKKSMGTVAFRVKDIYFEHIDLRLSKSDKPLEVLYTMKPKQDKIAVEDSKWNYKGYKVAVKDLIMPFNLNTLIATIPTTLISVDSFASAYVSGDFLVNPIETNLNVDLLKFNYNNIKMEQTSTSLKVRFDETLRVTSSETINLAIDELDVALNNTSLIINDDKVKLLNSNIKIKNLGKIKLNADYLFASNDGSINIEKIALKNDKLGEIYTSNKNTKLEFKSAKNSIKINSKELGINFINKKNSWIVDFNSFTKLSPYSKLLQTYHITDGSFQISKNNSKKEIIFYTKINFPYKILVIDNKPVWEYKINGFFDTTSSITSLNINNRIDVVLDKDINVNAKKIGINIDEVLRYFEEKEPNNKKDNIDLFFNADNSYIYISKDRHIISDTIELQYYKDILSAQLKHKKGYAGFKLQDKNFYLHGNNFNDEFMEELFALSEFKGGKLSFSMIGTLDNYNGLMHIKDTTIVDYKILNNMLAFVNTIPSLTTFSLPGYSKNGLEVKKAYLKFDSKDDLLTLTDISLDSKELDIVGKGLVSFKYNAIDLTLNLKTNLGSSTSKIPIVGYILLNKDTVSTSMRVSGKLNDPDIKSLIVKDIAVVPFNILKRTLMLPLHLIEEIDKISK